MRPIHKTPSPSSHLWKVLVLMVQIQCMLFFLNTPVKTRYHIPVFREFCKMNQFIVFHIKLIA